MSIEGIEELKRSLQEAFPRLHDLYIDSERNHPKNYFEQPNCLAAVRRCDDKLLAIEQDLQQLDAKAWLDFKAKTIRLLTTTDRWGWNIELFDRFDEAIAKPLISDRLSRCRRGWPARDTPGVS